MKKSLIAMATVAALSVTSLGLLTGCNLFGGKGKKVGDVTSFMAATGKNAKIQLTADIDFNGEEVEPIALKSLNGNGHTIKNAKVLPGLNIRNASNTGHFISLLGEHTQEVRDVTFENITIEDSGYAKYASFVAVACLEMDNVVVKDSTMKVGTSLYVGGLTCHQKYIGILADFQSEGSTPTNSGIENCSITVDDDVTYLGGITYSGMGENLYAKKLSIHADNADYVGGLLGEGSLKNCYVEESSIYAGTVSSDGLTPLYVGGLSGRANSAVNCYVSDTEIEANAPHYSKGLTGVGSVAEVYAGGIGGSAGYKSNIQSCYASKTKINVFCTGTVYAGGIVGGNEGKINGTGTIKNCYVINGAVEADGYVAEYRSDIYSAQKRALGGIIGYAHSSTISASFAYGNKVYEHSLEGKDIVLGGDYMKNVYMSAGGLIGAKGSGVTATECAVAYTVKPTSHHNAGAVYGDDRLTATPTVYTELTDEEWLDGTTLMEKLELDEEYWIFEAGKLPTLKMEPQQETDS